MTRRVVRDVLLPRSVLDTKAVVQQLVHDSLDPDRYGVWWFVEYAFKRFVVGHDLKRLPVQREVGFLHPKWPAKVSNSI